MKIPKEIISLLLSQLINDSNSKGSLEILKEILCSIGVKHIAKPSDELNVLEKKEKTFLETV